MYLSFYYWLISLSIMSPGSAMLSQMARCPSFLRLNNIPLYPYTTFSLSIHLSMDTWVVSISCLSWIMLQCTWECRYFSKILTSIILDVYPEVRLLDHMVVLVLIFQGTSILFSKAAEPFFLDMLPKAQATKTKIDKWDSIILKTSAQQRKQSTEWKGNLQNGRKCWPIIYLISD